MPRRIQSGSEREEFRNLLRDHFAERLARKLDPESYPEPKIDRKYYEESALRADEVLRKYENNLLVSSVVSGVVDGLGDKLKTRVRFQRITEVALVLGPFTSGALLSALAAFYEVPDGESTFVKALLYSLLAVQVIQLGLALYARIFDDD